MNTQFIQLLTDIKANLASFNDVIEHIAVDYHHQPTAFKNGDVYNEATQNQGSAKVFAFAQLHNLSPADTLCLFAEHYQAVLANAEGADHQNIRQFMRHGWERIAFEGEPLVKKQKG